MNAHYVEVMANIKYGRDKYIASGTVIDMNDGKTGQEQKQLLQDLLKSRSRLVQEVAPPVVAASTPPADTGADDMDNDATMNDDPAAGGDDAASDLATSAKKNKLKTQ